MWAHIWSNYKHNSTITFLLGITPQGTISFVSDCVGGHITGKEIVAQSFAFLNPDMNSFVMIIYVQLTCFFPFV